MNGAFGINAYELYQNQQKPNWDSILNSMNNDYYGLVILDNSTGIKVENIVEFDYNKFLSKFEKPLELRKVNVNKFPLFRYLYAQTKAENFQDL